MSPIYDLYYTDTNERGSIPFSYSWPIPPQGTLTRLTVTNATSLAAALATSNAEITVTPGSYGALAITQDDQRWILDDNATFSDLSASGRPSRIHIRGGRFEISNSTNNSIQLIVDDWLLENVCIDSVNSVNVGLGDQPSNRYALIRSTVIAQRYAHFTPGPLPERGCNHILAGNHLQGGMLAGNSGVEATVRTQAVNEVVLIDNWLRNGFDGQGIKHTLRSHYGQSNWWARNNLVVYGDGAFLDSSGGTLPDEVMGRHYLYDNIQYVPSNNPNPNTAHILRQSADMAQFWPNPTGAIVVVGNRSYDYRATSASADRYFLNTQAWDTVSDNVNDVYSAPPVLSAWLVDGGVPPGCDH